MLSLSSRRCSGFLSLAVFSGLVYAGDASQVPLTSYKCGISLEVLGNPGVDYACERFYHDPLIDDHGVVYVRSTSRLNFKHNERNVLNNSYSGLGVVIGADGANDKPGDKGVIRFKPDMDWNWRFSWSNGYISMSESLPEDKRFPRFDKPLSFAELTYFDGSRVLGAVGPSQSLATPPTVRTDDFYWRGFRDECGDEWHIITVGDDDQFVPDRAKIIKYGLYDAWSSDGRVWLFVVDPKTPAISFLAGDKAQYYTTPAKTYFVPKIHQQTTYLSAGVSIALTNLTDPQQAMQWRIDEMHHDTWKAYESPVLVDGLGLTANTRYTLRCRVGPHGVERVRILHFAPAYPSDAEPHPSAVLFKDEAMLARIRNNIATSVPHKKAYAQLFSAFSGGHGSYAQPLMQGVRCVGGAASANAFPVFIAGIGKHPLQEKMARDNILDTCLALDPIGTERNHCLANPCRERVYHGYYYAGKILDVALAYDLLIRTMRSPASPHGFSAIEDLKIRDSLGSYALETMQIQNNGCFPDNDVGWPDIAPSNKPAGMWDTAQFLGLQLIAMIMPTYDSVCYGTSGADGKTKPTHPFTPYWKTPVAWFEGSASRAHMNGPYSGLITDEATPKWRSRHGYFGGMMMGWLYAIQANARMNFDGQRFPHVERAFMLAAQGELPVTTVQSASDSNKLAYWSCLMMNEHFPDIAKLSARQFAENPDLGKGNIADRSREFSIWAHSILSLCYDRPDWETVNKKPVSPSP
ncbi:MAG: hypothetical protein AAB263_08545 [Planctomycetota bacterium]